MGRPSDALGGNGGRSGGDWVRCICGSGLVSLRDASAPLSEETDALLDEFMPEYEVAERHHVRVAAPADITLSAAMETDLQVGKLFAAFLMREPWYLGPIPTRSPVREGCSRK